MRYFEKISFEQFQKDVKDDKALYEEYRLPQRATKHSAGYEFYAIEDIVLQPGETKRIPTGYKMKCNNDEVLLVFIRSSMGFKYNIRMMNQVGVIDSDYYGNMDNEGHIWVALQNQGNEERIIHKNQGYVQGIFVHFLTVDDDVAENERKGGIGSTG